LCGAGLHDATPALSFQLHIKQKSLQFCFWTYWSWWSELTVNRQTFEVSGWWSYGHCILFVIEW